MCRRRGTAEKGGDEPIAASLLFSAVEAIDLLNLVITGFATDFKARCAQEGSLTALLSVAAVNSGGLQVPHFELWQHPLLWERAVHEHSLSSCGRLIIH